MLRRPTATVWCDRLVDAGVVGFAAWTIGYHLCLALRLGVPWAWAITALVVVAWGALRWRSRDAPPDRADAPQPTEPDPDGTGRRDPYAVATVLAAGVAAAGMAARAPWDLVWTSWLVAAVAGTIAAWRGLRRRSDPASADPAWWELPLVLAWAVAMAVLALWTMGPNGDDLFYVNLSQWVATHGEFPVRDTLFADRTYPMSNWPPVASYDALVGAVAALVGVPAGTVAYVVVPPAACFLAVLVLWQLLRAWRVRPAVLALSVGLVSILVAHGEGVTAGEALATRIWQGKFLLAWIAVPWLLARMVGFYDDPRPRRAAVLLAGSVAAVGLSTTGIFVVPVIALAGAAALMRTSWRAAGLCFVATAGYPLGAGVVTLALDGRSADLFGTRKLHRFDPELIGHSMFWSGAIAVALVLAVLLAALLLPHPAARLSTALVAVALGLVFVPGLTELSYDLVGLGPTLRRLRYGLPVAALVGAAAVWVGTRLPGPRWLALGGAALAACLVFQVAGAPLRNTSPSWWQQPFHWQRTDADRHVTAQLLRDEPLDGLVLAPSSLAVTIAVTTTSVKTVAPRAYYMDYLREEPSFRYDERLVLVRFVNSARSWRASRQPELEQALGAVEVAVACVYAEARDRAAGLRRAGLTPYVATRTYRCFRSTEPHRR